MAGCCLRDVVHLVHPQEGLIWAQGGKSRTAVTPREASPEARPPPSRGARKGPGQGSGTSRSTTWYSVCVCVCLVVSDATILLTVALQAPRSMGFSRQDYWSRLPSPLPGNLPDPGIEPASPVFPALQVYSLPAGAIREAWYCIGCAQSLLPPQAVPPKLVVSAVSLPWTPSTSPMAGTHHSFV